MFATSQTQAVLVTVRIVDQVNVEIPGSVIGIPALGLTAITGSSLQIPAGIHSFSLLPLGGNGPLRRDEESAVTLITTEIAFQWITSDVLLRVSDQRVLSCRMPTWWC